METLEFDGLTDSYERRSMGAFTEDGPTVYRLDRASQDAWAAASHQRAKARTAFHSEEIAPFTLASRAGDTLITDNDFVRTRTSAEFLGKLRPAFSKEGTISSQQVVG